MFNRTHVKTFFVFFLFAAICAVFFLYSKKSSPEIEQPVVAMQPAPKKDVIQDASENTPVSKTPTDKDDVEVKITMALKNNHDVKRSPSQVLPKPEFLAPSSLLSGTRWKIWTQAKISTDGSLTQGTKVSNLTITDEDASNSTINRFDPKDPIVLFNERLKKPGVLTGTIKLEASNRALLEADLKRLHATITDSFEHIQTYFIVGSDNVFDLEYIFENLKQLSYVQNVELEILSKNYEKN